MKFKKMLSYIFVISMMLSLLNAVDIEGRGASFPAKVYNDWCSAYNHETGNHITYTATGSGDGILSIKNRKVDFGGSDKPLVPWRLRRYNLSMFPTIIGSIVLAYNIPGVKDNELKLSEKAISSIFSGEVKYWDDTIITINNKYLNLPHKPIKVAVRNDGSGTTYNFTYYLRKIDYSHFKKAQKEFDWKANIIEGEGNKGVTANIIENEYSIGYIEYSYKVEANLAAATIENRVGSWVRPSIASCRDGAKYAKLDKNKDFCDMIAYPKGKTSYPIIATSFILLSDEKHEENKEIMKFYNWVFKYGSTIAEKYGYVSLPDTTVEEIKSYWKSRLI